MTAIQTMQIPKLAEDSALLYRIKQDLDTPLVGEDRNKLQLFLICQSSKCLEKHHLGAVVTGESSAGKSELLKRVLNYFPNVFEVTRMTAASPDRLGEDFSNRILKVEELKGAEAAQATIRVWISEGHLKLLTTEKSDDGKLKAQLIETTGVPVFVTTTTSADIDDELANRIFTLSIDESTAQTQRILHHQAHSFMEPSIDWTPSQDAIDTIDGSRSRVR